MSSTCGNCSCADQSQCVNETSGSLFIEDFCCFSCKSSSNPKIYPTGKKGNSYGIEIIETEKKSYDHNMVEVPAAENGGDCKCGSSCACVNCTCGN